MKMKYCPECGSIQLQSSFNELKCRKCGFSGTMKEDSVDVINSFIASKKIQANRNSDPSMLNPELSSQNAVSNVNSFNSTALIQQKNKPQSLKERLKKFEDLDIEIL
ncbi:MAG: hypothetical protein ABIJ74_03380 [archaeon]